MKIKNNACAVFLQKDLTSLKHKKQTRGHQLTPQVHSRLRRPARSSPSSYERERPSHTHTPTSTIPLPKPRSQCKLHRCEAHGPLPEQRRGNACVGSRSFGERRLVEGCVVVGRILGHLRRKSNDARTQSEPPTTVAQQVRERSGRRWWVGTLVRLPAQLVGGTTTTGTGTTAATATHAPRTCFVACCTFRNPAAPASPSSSHS